MDPLLIFYMIGIVGSVSLFVRPFMAKYRQGPRWIRIAHFLAAPLILVWSGLSLFLVFYGTHLSRLSFWRLNDLKSLLCGMFLGILILMFLSPEYRSLRRLPPPSP